MFEIRKVGYATRKMRPRHAADPPVCVDDERILETLRRRYPLSEIAEGRVPVTITAALSAYFNGDLTAIDSVQVTLDGTPFQRLVWTALRQIPARTTTSYGALARALFWR